MCMLCDQVTGQSFRIVKPNDRLALYGLSIAPAELLDNGSVGVTRRATATDGVLDYYLHAPGGAVTVSGGGFGEQEIQSIAIPGPDQDYFNAIVRRLDSIIDLDFHQVDVASSADVDIYYDTEIDLGDGGSVLGMATTSGVGGWELYLNYSALESDDAYRKYALIHEFGHSLGLEHPFEASDGDVFNGITDPWSSAYPEETVMAYRNPLNLRWPEFFSDNDLNALIQVWGAERMDISSDGEVFQGKDYKEVLQGSHQSDIVYGMGGNDQIYGAMGNDELRGGRNADWIKGGKGNDQLFGGRGHDFVDGGKGDDRIRGGFGQDTFVFSSGNDWIEDFNLSQNDKVLVHFDMEFSLSQVGNSLKIFSSNDSLTLWNTDKLEFIDSDSFLYF